MANDPFTGVLAFPITPFDRSSGQFDVVAYEKVLAHMIDGGVHSLIPLGSTGEFAYLRPDERKKVAEATISITKDRVPVVVGVSAITTEEAVELAKHAQGISADGIMISIPTYYSLDADEVREHVARIAGAVKLPVMLYNNPFTSAVDLTLQLVDRLTGIENLVSIKEATMDINRISLLQQRFGNRFQILGGGFDPYAFPALCLGVKGWTTGLANLVPAKCVAMYEAVAVDGDLERGRSLHQALLPVASLFVEFGLAKAIKAGLEIMGIDAGVARAPLGQLSEQNTSRLRTALKDLRVVN